MKKCWMVLMFVLFAGGMLFADEAGELGTVVVSATRSPQDIRDLATNTMVIGSEELEKYSYNDLGEALEHITEAKIGRNGHIGAEKTVSLRGSTAEEVLVMIDGRAVNNRTFGTCSLNQIPLENVERIEIIKGGGSVLYGANAVGGVINVITKKGKSEKPLVDFGYEYQRYDTNKYKLNFEINRGPANGFFSAARTASNGFRKNEDFLGENMFIKLGYDFDNLGEISFSGNMYNDDRGVPGKNYTSIDKWGDDLEREALTPYDKMESENQYGIIEHRISGIFDTLFITRLYGNIDEMENKYEMSSWNSLSQNISKGVEMQANAPYGVTAGFDIRQDRYFQKGLSDNSMWSNKRLMSRAFYVQENFSHNGKLFLIPGIRFENHSEYDLQTNPKITAVYKINDSFKVSGNAGRGFRSLTFNEISYGPNLVPEKSYSYDIGSELEIGDSASVGTTLYRIDVEKLITWLPVLSNSTGRVRSQGVEVDVRHKIFDFLRHGLSYTYNSTRDRVTDKVFDYRPAHKINYRIGYVNNIGTSVDLSVEGVGRQFTDKIMENSLPGYAVADFRITQKYLSSLFYIGVDNFTGKRYMTRLDYPLPGKIYYVGLTIKFLS